MKRAAEKRKCPVATCPKEIRANYIFCGSHWRRTPKALKDAMLGSARQHWKEREALEKLPPNDTKRSDAHQCAVTCALDFRQAHDAALAILSEAA